MPQQGYWLCEMLEVEHRQAEGRMFFTKQTMIKSSRVLTDPATSRSITGLRQKPGSMGSQNFGIG